MNRDRVYAIIDGERDYQDKKWGTIIQHPQQVGSFLTLIRTLLAKAETEWANSSSDAVALEQIRKLTAVGVACMEQHEGIRRAIEVKAKWRLLEEGERFCAGDQYYNGSEWQPILTHGGEKLISSLHKPHRRLIHA